MSHWILYALASLVTGSISALIRRYIMKSYRPDPVSFTVYLQFGCGIIVLGIAWWNGFHFPDVQHYWPWLAFSMVCWAVSSVWYIASYQHLEASEITILGTLGAVFSVIFGVTTLGEKVSLFQASGIILILTGAYFIIARSRVTLGLSKGTWYCFGANVLSSAATVADTYILRHSDGLSYLSFAFLVPGILLLCVYPRSLMQFVKTPRTTPHFWKISILSAVIFSIAAASFYLAIEYGAPASQLVPVSQAGIVCTVILGWIFLAERDRMVEKSIAILCVLAGIYLLG